MEIYLLLFFAGLLAGGMNAVAGGGSFITFPALLYAGVPPVVANASSTVALFPGSAAGAWTYREYIRPPDGISMMAMALFTVAGGCAGAFLLLLTPSANFKMMVPWLLLIGSVAFSWGRTFGNLMRRSVNVGPGLVLSAQFLLGIYGGYFGGAVGIMMMAVWSIFGMSDIKVINANKNLLVALANSVAVVTFIAAGKVAWPQTMVMLVATVPGGYLGAYFSKQWDPARMRKGIIVFNFLITIVFFVRTYL